MPAADAPESGQPKKKVKLTPQQQLDPVSANEALQFHFYRSIVQVWTDWFSLAALALRVCPWVQVLASQFESHVLLGRWATLLADTPLDNRKIVGNSCTACWFLRHIINRLLCAAARVAGQRHT
jgi:hypothetical protein